MTTQVDKSIVVNVPIGTAYNQWTQFADFPQFMGGVKSVTTLGDDRLEWVAEIAGIRRQWEARVLEQIPDRKVAWAATAGATNAGEVTFADAGPGMTLVSLHLEYEPEGLVEKVGDSLNVVANQAEGDLDRFKAFIEDAGYATGAWRGSVSPGVGVATPGVEHADASRGDDGKAGVSGKAVAAGVGLAAAAVAGVVAAVGKKSSDDETTVTPVTPVTTTTTTPVTTAPVTTTPVATDPIGTAPVSSPVPGTVDDLHAGLTDVGSSHPGVDTGVTGTGVRDTGLTDI